MSESRETEPVAARVETVSPGVFEAAADREAIEKARRAAAPVAADVEAIGALEPDTRRALYTILSSVADNKYVLGRRYAEWCTGAPMLESAVAAAAMAQDELGHARSFYPLLRGFPDADAASTVEEQGWQDRPTHAVAALDQKFPSWTGFVAANFILDTAYTVLLDAATDSPYEPLRQRARKIRQEEEGHWVHARGWVGRLAREEGRGTTLEESLRAVWDDAFTWYGRPDDPVISRLQSASLLAASPDGLRERLLTRLRPVLEESKLPVPSAAASDLPWDRWDARERRLKPAR